MPSHNPFGDFTKTQSDVKPTKSSSRVNGEAPFRRLSNLLYGLHNSNLGRALTEAETKVFLNPTYMDIVIPEEDADIIDSRYLPNDVINSDLPERLAESRIDAVNAIDISDEEVEQVKEAISKVTVDLKDTILKNVVSFIALDNASAIVEAIMRDGIGINVTVDSSVVHSLSDITKLSVLQKLLDSTDLPENVRKAFMLNLTRGLTNDIGPLRKAENGLRYSQILQNVVLSRRNRRDDGEAESNPMGIIKKFSNNLKP